MAEIIGGKVVETILTDLSIFIEQKKRELVIYETQRDFAAAKASAVVAELEALTPEEMAITN